METNGLVDPQYYHSVDRTAVVDWTAPGLKVTRLRLISDPGFPWWDVSYCHGELNGDPVRVQVPFDQIRKGQVQRTIVHFARKDRVYAKGIGILDAISTLV